MKTLFIGGTKRGYQTLKALIEICKAEMVGVINLRQDDHEIERYEEKMRELATALKIPFYETKWMKEKDYASIISNELKPDIIFIVGCRIIIPDKIYTIPPLGTLAVHDSLLPEYRGFAPLNWAIINGESHTGVTLFYLNDLMDGGDIVAQKRTPIGVDDTAQEVYENLCKATVDVVVETYPLLARDEGARIKQDYNSGSFTCSRTPDDGMIDWNKPTREIYNLIRSLAYPYPGAFTFFEGRRLTIWKAKPALDQPLYAGRIPGRVVDVSTTDGSVKVLTADGVMSIFEVQLEGEEKAAAAKIVKSIRSTLGVSVAELMDKIRDIEAKYAE
jgi:methionyl-tRNA formyltransferase